MVAATSEQSAASAGGAETQQERIGHNVKEALNSARRLAQIQSRLLALHTKLTIQRIVIFLILVAAAAGIGIMGLIFLDIGLFHLFTLVMAPHWAFLLHAALHLGAAAVLFVWARNQFNKPNAFFMKSEKRAPKVEVHGGQESVRT